ncbi:MAG TPA: energy-coupling factor transporter transmembrane component T [Anaerolineae bacterium]|nr:energy-coupling factor transporter transmembrane component T [Anaerolineae bacterium]HQH39589.1 energy-coupling factor transporter transmembrane component T [Anaerolineae bacterium]
MSVALDFYVPRDTWLHRLDPRVKLWEMLLGFVTAFLLPYWWAQGAFLLGLHLLLLYSHIPWSALRRLWRQMAWLVGLILVLQPFFAPAGAVLVALGPLRLTVGGLIEAVLLAARALVIAFIIGVLLFTTDQRALVQAFVRLGMPYSWGLTFSLTLRFLPAIQQLFVTVREAQAARGWVVEGNLFRRLRDYLPVLVAVIIGTLRMSDRLTLALAARGLASTAPRTVWRDLRMRPPDWITFIVSALAFGLLLWVRWR